MAFNARSAADSARRLISGKRKVRTPKRASARAPENDASQKARMSKTSNLGS